MEKAKAEKVVVSTVANIEVNVEAITTDMQGALLLLILLLYYAR